MVIHKLKIVCSVHCAVVGINPKKF
jgi:hypothetical protein